jgi:kinesin family member C1
VFSTDLENLTPLPADGDDDTKADRTVKANKTKLMKDASSVTASRSNGGIDLYAMQRPAPDAEASFSSVSMDEEARVFGGVGAENSVQNSINEKRTEEMLNVIKGLGKKFEKLDRRLSEIHMPVANGALPPKPSMENTAQLDAKMIQIQTLTDKNSKLEMKNEQIGRELRSVESKLSAERQQLVIEKERLQSELEQTKSSKCEIEQKLKECQDKVDMLENELLPESEEQLRSAMEELNQYKDRVIEMGATLQDYEEMIRSLRSEIDRLTTEKDEEKQRFQILNEQSFQVHETMERQNMKKDKIIEDCEHSLAAAKAELQQARSRASEMQMELNDALSQLKQVSGERDDVHQKLLASMDQIGKDSELKNSMVANNTEKTAALKALDEHMKHLKKSLTDMEKEMRAVKKERDDAIFRLGNSDQREEDIFTRLRESERIRRELHAKVMVLIGSIRVFVRVRPLISPELEASKKETCCMNEIFHFTEMGGSQGVKKCIYGSDDPTKNVLEVLEPVKDRGGLSQRRKKWKFGFDQVFDPSHGQADVWEASEPLVQSAIDGYNVTIFAYGQTGSGKTHTMLGEVGSSDEGLIARSIRKLFDAKHDIEVFSRGEKQVNLSLELLEIYNEQVRDLLAEKRGSSTSGENHSLKIVANEAVGSIRQAVSTESDVFKILQTAQQRRCVKATSSNATSSRSHLLFTLQFTVHSKDGTNQSGKLNVSTHDTVNSSIEAKINSIGVGLLDHPP